MASWRLECRAVSRWALAALCADPGRVLAVGDELEGLVVECSAHGGVRPPKKVRIRTPGRPVRTGCCGDKMFPL
jgi:hypothetical protein